MNKVRLLGFSLLALGCFFSGLKSAAAPAPATVEAVDAGCCGGCGLWVRAAAPVAFQIAGTVVTAALAAAADGGDGAAVGEAITTALFSNADKFAATAVKGVEHALRELMRTNPGLFNKLNAVARGASGAWESLTPVDRANLVKIGLLHGTAASATLPVELRAMIMALCADISATTSRSAAAGYTLVGVAGNVNLVPLRSWDAGVSAVATRSAAYAVREGREVGMLLGAVLERSVTETHAGERRS